MKNTSKQKGKSTMKNYEEKFENAEIKLSALVGEDMASEILTHVKQKKRMVIHGNAASGKSTLIKAIANELYADKTVTDENLGFMDEVANDEHYKEVANLLKTKEYVLVTSHCQELDAFNRIFNTLTGEKPAFELSLYCSRTIDGKRMFTLHSSEMEITKQTETALERIRRILKEELDVIAEGRRNIIAERIVKELSLDRTMLLSLDGLPKESHSSQLLGN